MVTVWESVHSSSVERVGSILNSYCGACMNPPEKGGRGLKYCMHEVALVKVSQKNELALLTALTQESIIQRQNRLFDKDEVV